MASRCASWWTWRRTTTFVEAWLHTPGRKLLVASTSGNGFVVPEDEMVAMTRKGKQVMNLTEPDETHACVPAEGDTVAVIGENRKMLVFPLEQVNEMTRGKGVRLQRYSEGGLSDIRVFRKADGLTWLDPAGRTFTLPYAELKEWIGERAQAGSKAPHGLPKIEQVWARFLSHTKLASGLTGPTDSTACRLRA